ncbi:hypothetical protein AB9P05_21240 [Roseivirga sp. BDSF3-8]|uniref:hypothetical protein n=1 Tax=Roseivirga sp. BDSF3-8 TaxID=3241598 RepID=UPI0035320963
MAERPQNANKEQAGRLADLLYREQYGEATSLYRQLFPEVPQPEEEIEARDEDTAESPFQLGVWQQQGDQMVRNPDWNRQFHMWHDMESFPLTSNKKRILFIGESVASGFLFDRHYRPAYVLQGILDAEAKDLEVLDLARLGLGLDELIELLEKSPRLSPDAVVVFAGNNWLPQAHASLSETELLEIVHALNEPDKYHRIKKVVEGRLTDMASALVSQMEKVSKAGVPVTYILPGYNLKDWEGEIKRDNLLWPTTETEEWNKLIRKLKSIDDEPVQASEIARQLIEIQPIHPFGYELAGQCAMREGNAARAIEWFDQARETGMCRFTSSARIFNCIEKTIRQDAEAVQIISLPDILVRWSESGVPGKELFVDYCHLSPKGIRIAMSAVARQVLHTIAGKETDVDTLYASSPLPTAEEEGTGHLLAAILNAHFDQSHEVISYHCQIAAELSASAREFMKGYINMTFCPVPKYLTSWFKRLNQIETFKPYIYWHDYHESIKDIDLLYAMRDALDKAGEHYHGEVLVAEAKGLEILEDEYDLMDSQYFDSSFSPFEADNGYAAISGESVFYFLQDVFTEASDRFTLKVCLRAEKEAETASVFIIKLNGKEIASHPATTTWTTLKVPLDPGLIESNYNAISIEWPTNLHFTYRTDLSDGLEAQNYLSESFIARFGTIDSIRLYRRRDYPCQTKPQLSKEELQS